MHRIGRKSFRGVCCREAASTRSPHPKASGPKSRHAGRKTVTSIATATNGSRILIPVEEMRTFTGTCSIGTAATQMFDPTGKFATVTFEDPVYWTKNALEWQRQFQRIVTR